MHGLCGQSQCRRQHHHGQRRQRRRAPKNGAGGGRFRRTGRRHRPAPTNLVAAAQANQVALSWHDASGGAATNYIVLRSTTSGIGYSAIATNTSNTATNYTDTSVTAWTTYYYVVRAVASAARASIRPRPAPPRWGCRRRRRVWRRSPGNAQVVLTWNAETGATNFNVLRSTTSGSGFTTIASVMRPHYTDTAAGQRHDLLLRAECDEQLRHERQFGPGQRQPHGRRPQRAHLVINASNAVRTADTRWFGINARGLLPRFQPSGWRSRSHQSRLDDAALSRRFTSRQLSLGHTQFVSAATTTYRQFRHSRHQPGRHGHHYRQLRHRHARRGGGVGGRRERDQSLRLQVLGDRQRSVWHL